MCLVLKRTNKILPKADLILINDIQGIRFGFRRLGTSSVNALCEFRKTTSSSLSIFKMQVVFIFPVLVYFGYVILGMGVTSLYGTSCTHCGFTYSSRGREIFLAERRQTIPFLPPVTAQYMLLLLAIGMVCMSHQGQQCGLRATQQLSSSVQNTLMD